MARQPLDLNQLPHPAPQRYAECAVQGCTRCPRSFSRFCTDHARRFHRTRDPNGRAVRVGELKPYLQLAEEYLQRNASHPAVVAAEAFLQTNLCDATLPGEVRKEMQRLRVDGATPRAMLVNFLGVMALRFYLPHTVTTDACEAFNIGNRVLRTTPLPRVPTASGRTQPVRVKARVAEVYGEMLRQVLGTLAEQFWSRVQGDLEAPTRTARAVAEAVRRNPLAVPQAAPQELP